MLVLPAGMHALAVGWLRTELARLRGAANSLRKPELSSTFQEPPLSTDVVSPYVEIELLGGREISLRSLPTPLVHSPVELIFAVGQICRRSLRSRRCKRGHRGCWRHRHAWV